MHKQHINYNSHSKQLLAISVYTTTRRDVEHYKREIATRVGLSTGTIDAWLQDKRKLPKDQVDRILQEAAEIDGEQSG